MKLENAVVLVTGANRGIGLSFARAALARGARKVYAGARDPASVTLPGVVPIRLDVTRPADIAAAAAACGDVTLVVNNAGIARVGSFLAPEAEAEAQAHFDTNVLGILRMSRAFAPILAEHGGGGLLNVLSVLSWIAPPAFGPYNASKAAAWSLTNALRNELRAQGTQVLGLHMGYVDTDLVRAFDAPKTSPDVIAARAFDGLEAGLDEVLADEVSQQVHQGLSGTPAVYLTNAGG